MLDDSTKEPDQIQIFHDFISLLKSWGHWSPLYFQNTSIPRDTYVPINFAITDSYKKLVSLSCHASIITRAVLHHWEKNSLNLIGNLNMFLQES